MHLTLNMTTTVNGLASRENDSTDIFQRGEWPMLIDLAHETGALIWGRRTHEIVRGYGPGALQAFDGARGVVLTHDSTFVVEPGWTVATSPADAVEKLSGSGVARALVAGGGTTNASFIEAGLLDELVLFVESVVLGRGVPAFAPQPFELRLDLIDAERSDADLLKLRYAVKRS